MSKIPEGGLGKGTWRGAFWIAQRQAPLRGEGFGERGEGLPTEAGAVAFGIVVHAPGRERGAGMVQGREQRLVQQFVTQAAVEALDEGVLGRLARRDVVPVDPAVVGEGQDRVQGELGPVAADYGLGLSANFEQGRQLPCYPCAGQGRVGDQREAFPVQSSTTVSTRKRRPSVSWSDTKSSDQSWVSISGNVIGARVPIARLRPPRRRT